MSTSSLLLFVVLVACVINSANCSKHLQVNGNSIDWESSWAIVYVTPARNQCGICADARTFLFGIDAAGVNIRVVNVGNRHAKQAKLTSGEKTTLARMESTDLQSATQLLVIYHAPAEVMAAPGLDAKSLMDGLGLGHKPRRVVFRLVFETTSLPPSWSQLCNKAADEIWTSTKFNVETFKNGGVPGSKIKVVGQGFSRKHFKCKLRMARQEGNVSPRIPTHQFLRKDTHILTNQQGVTSPFPQFVVLSVFDWHIRKGWDVLVAAFFSFKQFVESNNPGLLEANQIKLVLKTSSNFGIGRQAMTAQLLDVLEQLGYQGKHLPPYIELNTSHLSTKDMMRLYESADVFALPTRGEGWGRPLTEAGLCGVPIITTGWGGALEFLDNSTAVLLPFSLESTSMTANSTPVLVEGGRQQWAKPCIKCLAAELTRSFNEPASLASMSSRLRSSLREQVSEESVMLQFWKLSSDIMKQSSGDTHQKHLKQGDSAKTDL